MKLKNKLTNEIIIGNEIGTIGDKPYMKIKHSNGKSEYKSLTELDKLWEIIDERRNNFTNSQKL